MTNERRNKLYIRLKRKKRLLIGFGTVDLIIIMIFLVDFTNLINKILLIYLEVLIFFFMEDIQFYIIISN